MHKKESQICILGEGGEGLATVLAEYLWTKPPFVAPAGQVGAAKLSRESHEQWNLSPPPHGTRPDRPGEAPHDALFWLRQAEVGCGTGIVSEEIARVFEDLTDWDIALGEIARILKSGGQIRFCEPNLPPQSHSSSLTPPPLRP